MIGRIEERLRKLRRGISRSRWMARVLRLPAGVLTHPGLVMVQIDGLSRQEFQRSIEKGEMPFLKRLLNHEHYKLHAHYPGLPTSTPGVQGELFYGISEIVPAFGFLDHKRDKLVRMLEPGTAARVEADLLASGNSPLLKDGSSYVNIYTGGAAEPHFCPAAMGWGSALRNAHPLAIILFIAVNAASFVRAILLTFLEFGIATVDFFRGLNRGFEFIHELKFIPTRVAICILLRELARIGAEIDIERGLPIIHLNFLGYDEQAHRRGPGSLFAHWTLKGIDQCIGRLWSACHRSVNGQYELWIYSDHGQVTTTPYHKVNGRSLEAAVNSVFQQHGEIPAEVITYAGDQSQRVRLLGGKLVQKLFSMLGLEPIDTEPVDTEPVDLEPGDSDKDQHLFNKPRTHGLRVAALGPLGFIYPDQLLSGNRRRAIARTLVEKAGIPVIVTKDEQNDWCAWTVNGCHHLPDEGASVFGSKHPYLEEICRELIDLGNHPDSGEFMLLGWGLNRSPISFSTEHGSHGGIACAETDAFALLPADTALPTRQRRYLRPVDLRRAALHHMGREPLQAAEKPRRTTGDTLRVMTYNVHFCQGMDGKLDPERIARVIARANPDVVALQELDVGRTRSEAMDQAHLIARYLEMDFYFHPAMEVEEEAYGDAILTHLPMRLIKAGALPGPANKPQWEPRGALWVAVEFRGVEYQIINTHLGLLPEERKLQIQALMGSDWIGHADCQPPLILCGDLNAQASSRICRMLESRLVDAQLQAENHRPSGTFFSRLPVARIDHIFLDSVIDVTAIEIPKHALARVASDHLPLVADLNFKLPE